MGSRSIAWFTLFDTRGRFPFTGLDAEELLEGVQDERLRSVIDVEVVFGWAFMCSPGFDATAVSSTWPRLSRGGGTFL